MRARAADADGLSERAARDYGAALASAPDNPLVAEMLDFIANAGRRGLIRTAVHADDDDEA